MMRYSKLLFGLLLAIFLVVWVARTSGVEAQIQDGRWATPYRLSSEDTQASRAQMISDPYGIVHVFWFERYTDGSQTLEYTQFDGENWADPIDIYFTSPGTSVDSLTPSLDSNNNVYIAWREGSVGPIKFTYAPVYDALSARKWVTPAVIEIPARDIQFKIDKNGTFHFLYTNTFNGQERGVYYSHSEDQGVTWSLPLWLDDDIPINYQPMWPQLQISETGVLHAVWQYLDISPLGGIGQWVRYARSTDGGFSWSAPFTIDIADETPDELRMPNPGIAVENDEVLVVWAGDQFTHRESRFSTDGGLTWSEPLRIFGDLLGQAIGDGLAVDAIGRIHFVGQIRNPQGLYHAIWDGEGWSEPELFYLIAESGNSEIGDRIHAHNVQLITRQGNQLVSTFTTSPGDLQLILYASWRTLDDVPESEVLPMSVSEVAITTPTPVITTPAVLATPNVPTIHFEETDIPPDRGISFPIWAGITPSLLILSFVIGIWLVRRQ